MIRLGVALAVAASMAACVSPTPYRAAGTEGNRFGYASTQLTDHLYRVRFIGTQRTPLRWVDAFLLYRSAEIAQEAGAPAFRVVEGRVDTGILGDRDVFGSAGYASDVAVTTLDRRGAAEGDRVVGQATWSMAGMQAVAGRVPVFRMPPPRPPPSSAAPILIYTPGHAAPVFPDRSLLIELRPDLSDIDAKTFVTADVLGNLGPRIRRAPAGDARPATRPEASS